MPFDVDKTKSENSWERKLSYAEVQHVDGLPGPVIPHTEVGGSAINIFLIVTCFAFGCSSFLFGFDNSVIGPVVALESFVSNWLIKLISALFHWCHGSGSSSTSY